MLETGIVAGGLFTASLSIALDACEFFELNSTEANFQARRIAKMIAIHWKQALKEEGATPHEVRDYTDAFEHDDASKVRSLS